MSDPCFCHLNGYEVKDARGRISAAETEFKAGSILMGMKYGLDVLTIEYFDTTDHIDSTAGNGATVISTYYDADRHQIVIPDGVTVSFQCEPVTADHNVRGICVHGDYEGAGTISYQYSTDGGSTFDSLLPDTLEDNSDNNRSLVMKVTITGALTLKNIGWGVTY